MKEENLINTRTTTFTGYDVQVRAVIFNACDPVVITCNGKENVTLTKDWFTLHHYRKAKGDIIHEELYSVICGVLDEFEAKEMAYHLLKDCGEKIVCRIVPRECKVTHTVYTSDKECEILGTNHNVRFIKDQERNDETI